MCKCWKYPILVRQLVRAKDATVWRWVRIPQLNWRMRETCPTAAPKTGDWESQRLGSHSPYSINIAHLRRWNCDLDNAVSGYILSVNPTLIWSNFHSKVLCKHPTSHSGTRKHCRTFIWEYHGREDSWLLYHNPHSPISQNGNTNSGIRVTKLYKKCNAEVDELLQFAYQEESQHDQLESIIGGLRWRCGELITTPADWDIRRVHPKIRLFNWRKRNWLSHQGTVHKPLHSVVYSSTRILFTQLDLRDCGKTATGSLNWDRDWIDFGNCLRNFAHEMRHLLVDYSSK